MAGSEFDKPRLDLTKYVFKNPLEAAKFQRTVEDFMGLLESSPSDRLIDQKLLDEFCSFVDGEQVWHLAQMVVPEFRPEREELYDSMMET